MATARKAASKKAATKVTATKKTATKKTATKKIATTKSASRKVVGKQPAGKTAVGRQPASKKVATGKAASRAPARKNAPPKTLDAIRLLTQDHRDVHALFEDYQALVDDEAEGAERQALAAKICEMLSVHAQIEEEIFYPAARESLDEGDLVDEAAVEHASARELVAQIRAMQPDDDLYDAKVKVLGEYVDHHVDEEEGEMFPKCRKAGLDLTGLGEQLKARKAELLPQETDAAAETEEAEPA